MVANRHKAESWDRELHRLEESEVIEQERIAKKMIETEMLTEAKSDELSYKEIELHKQEKRLNDQLSNIKIDKVQVSHYMDRIRDDERVAREKVKDYVDQ
jgi:hypothetical protein